MSSSPLPSPNQLFRQQKPPNIPTGSSALSIPPGASASFTTASALLGRAKPKTKVPSIVDTNNVAGLDILEKTKAAKPRTKKVAATKTDGEPKPARARKPKASTAIEDTNVGAEVKNTRKPRVKKSEICARETGEMKVLAPKKPRAKKADKEPVGEPKEKAPRKPRAKKAIDTSQGRLGGMVTKPVSRSKKSKVDSGGLENPQDFGLIEAVKRKTTWTPPAPTARPISITPASAIAIDKDLDSAGDRSSGQTKQGFGDLFGSFGFANSGSSVGESSSTTTKTQEKAIIRKRKLIELVKTGTTDGAISPSKKAPKKKPRTITGLATAAYADPDDAVTEPAALLKYFSLQTKNGDSNDGFKLPRKPQSKSRAKGSKNSPILLSPESAMKHVSNQDFVFGTSSQLAREDSPTLLRDLHQAMQASLEQFDPPDFLDDPFSSPTNPKRDLWNAASRGANGELLDVEMLEVIAPLVIGSKSGSPDENDEWLDIDDLPKIKEKELPQVELPPEQSMPSSPPPRQARQSVSPEPSQVRSNLPHAATAVEMPQMPNYASNTTAELMKEIASYHFKPVKSRDAMIRLLERCWEGKHRAALQTLDANVPKTISTIPPDSMKASPKRPRGRPRKDSSAAASPAKVGRPRKDTSAATSPIAKPKLGRPKKGAAPSGSGREGVKARTPKKVKKPQQTLEDISDSDVPLTPSPPRRRLSKTGKPPSPLRLRAEDPESSPERTSSQTQALLFEHITKAVTGAPPARDSKDPSWHEKILLYDPIVLEDLAAWLNTGALGKSGWDGEVEPAEVKKWCESKSICCLWRANLTGGSRNRY